MKEIAIIQSLAIRRADDGDAPLLADIGAQTFHETFAADNKPEDLNTYLNQAFGEQQQKAELAEPGTTYFIAEIDGRAVGYARLSQSVAPACVVGPKPIELARLYILSKWFGRGVGDALMNACLDEASRLGFQTIWLGVWERNFRAQSFYQKWQFRVVGDHIFQLGSDLQTDLLMERQV